MNAPEFSGPSRSLNRVSRELRSVSIGADTHVVLSCRRGPQVGAEVRRGSRGSGQTLRGRRITFHNKGDHRSTCLEVTIGNNTVFSPSYSPNDAPLPGLEAWKQSKPEQDRKEGRSCVATGNLCK